MAFRRVSFQFVIVGVTVQGDTSLQRLSADLINQDSLDPTALVTSVQTLASLLSELNINQRNCILMPEIL